MINLLPSDQKKSVSYARHNTHLFHWAVALMCVMVVFALLLFAGQWYINQSTKNLNKQVESTKAELEAQQLTETQNKIKSVTDNVKLIDQVLSKQVLFSKLIQQIGAVMPSGTVLTGVQLAKIEGGINLTAEAKTSTTATQIQVNLQDPESKLFTKADIISINCADANESGYPCAVNIRAQFAEKNPFLFVSEKPSGGSNQ